jgi:NAD(P)H-dependent flavin oxidoreductase YrpB (nitropropane dioxygenase family)
MSMSILEHPIVLAPMAGFGTIELAAAVADAGRRTLWPSSTL